MGYYTKYSLTTKGKDFTENEMKEIADLKKEANKLSGKLKEIALKGIEEKEMKKIYDPETLVTLKLKENFFNESCKWYDHEINMRSISKDYPDTIFILEGEGEEAGDIWIKYFLNGKMQVAKAKITFEEFDPKKLK